MNAEKLLKTLPALQAQLDSLLEFDCSSNDLSNMVINTSYMLLFRDLIRLFACYNDGIINLLGACPFFIIFFFCFGSLCKVIGFYYKIVSCFAEKYFDMNKKQCRDALDLYKRFLIRMDRVGEFLKVAEVSSKLSYSNF